LFVTSHLLDVPNADRLRDHKESKSTSAISIDDIPIDSVDQRLKVEKKKNRKMHDEQGADNPHKRKRKTT